MSSKNAPASPARDVITKSIAVLLTLGLFVALSAIGIQLTIKDRWAPFAPFFYMLPYHVVGLLLLVLAAVWKRRKHPRRALVHLGLAFACGGLFIHSSWQPRTAAARADAPSRDESVVRVVTWNLFHGRLGGEGAIAELAKLEPDIAGLVECGDLGDDAAAWSTAFPGYTVVPFDEEIVVVTRGTVRKPRFVRLGERSRVALCEIELEKTSCTLCVVDLEPSPFRDKRPTFEKLASVTADLKAPAIILGDFNVPSTSTCFAELAPRFRSSLALRGGGFGFTWPSPLPLWSLDQIWVDERWRTLGWNNPGTVRSDHRPFVVDVATNRD